MRFVGTPRWFTVVASLAMIGAFQSASVIAADKPLDIKPDQARDHIGKLVTIIMTVKKAKYSEKRNTVFLDSELDFKDPKNLAVILEADVLKKFKESGTAAPQDHFRDKTIKAQGKLELREDRPYLSITSTADIEIKTDTKS